MLMKKIIAYGAGAAFRDHINSNMDEYNILCIVNNYLEQDNIKGIKIYIKRIF